MVWAATATATVSPCCFLAASVSWKNVVSDHERYDCYQGREVGDIGFGRWADKDARVMRDGRQ